MTDQPPWRLTFHSRAQKDAVLVERAGLRERAEAILEVLRRDPFASPQPFEKLRGDLTGMYSRRLNIQHRIVYGVLDEEREVRILRM